MSQFSNLKYTDPFHHRYYITATGLETPIILINFFRQSSLWCNAHACKFSIATLSGLQMMAFAAEASSSSMESFTPLGAIVIAEEASIVQAAQEASTSREQAGEYTLL